MIVGSGNIARCLTDRENAIFFASGVSNSRCEDKEQFDRERDLLYETARKNYQHKCLFYFSSARLNFLEKSTRSNPFNATPYEAHKRDREHSVRIMFPNYVILRIGNLIGDTNPNTFINYIKNRQAQGLSVEIRDEYKYMIDGATLNMLCQTLPLDQKIEITVATKIAKVRDLL